MRAAYLPRLLELPTFGLQKTTDPGQLAVPDRMRFTYMTYYCIQMQAARSSARRSPAGCRPRRFLAGHGVHRTDLPLPLDRPAGNGCREDASEPEIRLGPPARRIRLLAMNDMKPLTQRRPDAALLERLKAVVGPKGWLDQPADLAPHLVDWRRRFQGKTPLLLKPATTAEVAEVVRLCASGAGGHRPPGRPYRPRRRRHVPMRPATRSCCRWRGSTACAPWTPPTTPSRWRPAAS